MKSKKRKILLGRGKWIFRKVTIPGGFERRVFVLFQEMVVAIRLEFLVVEVLKEWFLQN